MASLIKVTKYCQRLRANYAIRAQRERWVVARSIFLMRTFATRWKLRTKRKFLSSRRIMAPPPALPSMPTEETLEHLDSEIGEVRRRMFDFHSQIALGINRLSWLWRDLKSCNFDQLGGKWRHRRATPTRVGLALVQAEDSLGGRGGNSKTHQRIHHQEENRTVVGQKGHDIKP